MKQRETLIRKIIPVELFDMAGLEHWLSDMAAQGLHLVKLNHDTARFRRGEPVPGVRFGLEITFSVPDKDEYLYIVDQLAAESGIGLPADQLHLLAERFALRRNGRSPRTARQFISQQLAEKYDRQ